MKGLRSFNTVVMYNKEYIIMDYDINEALVHKINKLENPIVSVNPIVSYDTEKMNNSQGSHIIKLIMLSLLVNESYCVDYVLNNNQYDKNLVQKIHKLLVGTKYSIVQLTPVKKF